MSESFLFDVFLSHSSKDKAIARQIAEQLQADGIRVWFDEWVLKPGDHIQAKIEEGLDSSRVLVLCMSANAFGSDWSQLEAGTFRFRDPSNKDCRFIPVRVDDAPIKGSLAQFLYIDWLSASREQEYAKLLEVCRLSERSPIVVVRTVQKQFTEKAFELKHGAEVYDYTFDPKTSRAASVCKDRNIQLWNSESWDYLGTLKGHTGEVNSASWSSDGQRLLSCSDDRTVRLWDVGKRHCLRVFKGHADDVNSVVWSADSKYALSGSDDRSMRLWDVETGRCLSRMKGHKALIFSVALSSDQKFALSGSDDATVRLWEVKTGRTLNIFEGHTGIINAVQFSSDQRFALSCSHDRTIRLWDVQSGRCLHKLEGHAAAVRSIACSSNCQYVLSGSTDMSVRVWDIETGECLEICDGHRSAVRRVIWSIDGRRALSGDDAGGVRIWDMSNLALLRVTQFLQPQSIPLAQVQYTNAKVLLVGDTGVGKSSLAERLIRNRFVPTKSSHARKAHVLDTQVIPSAGGVTVHRETMLWDLAGQPAYRLVHQLSLEDATLACVLFDNRSETNPFEGAAYWSQVLDQARTGTKVKRILVASRTDVGGLPASRERIESFARDHGFTEFIPTSANTGAGCEDLLEAIRGGIAWEQLPTVTTEGPLAPLRAYIGALKGERNGRIAVASKLLTVSQLHEGFSADYGKKIPRDEFIAHLKRLEDTDAVKVLVFHSTNSKPGAETLVLLDPTRVDAYASALLVAAKDEPDGPGHLRESSIREGRFTLDREERLADPDSEKHVLWFVLEHLLSRDLALRETIKGDEYIVFPSQCTAELQFPGVAVFGVGFGFAGPVRNIYAVLIAQLAHFEGFNKREFFHDAAAYRPDAGGRCIIRLRDHGRGQGELELSFELDTPPTVRQGFIEFVGKFLESRSTLGSVTKRHAYLCVNRECRKPFDDAVVQARLAARKKQLVCPYCDKKTPLVDLLAAPTGATQSVVARIDTDAVAGRRRMTAALVIKAKEAEGMFDVFLSHNAKDKGAVEKIAKRLLAVGIRPWLDKWNLSPGDTVSDALEKAIKTIPCAALCFGPADVGKWHIMEMRAYVERWASGDARMIPLILPNVKEMPELPIFIRQTLWVDMRSWEQSKDDGFYRLVCGIAGKQPGDSPMRKFGARDVAKWQGFEL